MMAAQQPAHPEPDEIELVGVLHALSDPIRLEMVRLLGDGAEHPCAGFHGLGGITVPTLSHHLRVLREAGLTRTRLAGKHRFVTLRGPELADRFPGVLAAIVGAAPTP